MDNSQEYFGWAAACLNVCHYIAPVIPFINVIKGKLNYEDTPGVFISTCYANSFVWYIYGDMILSDQIKIANCIIACISLILIFIYLIYELKKYWLDSILNALILMSGSWAVYRTLVYLVDDEKIIGKIAVATLLLVYLNPIYILYKVIKEKNYIIIPIYPIWVYLFGCVAWIIYGIYLSDLYIVIPHIGGIIISLLQILIFVNYKRKYPVINEKIYSSTIGIESTGKEEPKIKENSVKIDENLPGKEKPVKIITKTES